MRKILLILLILFNFNVSYGIQCIIPEEEKGIDDKIEFYNNYYSQVPNMVSCKENSAINRLICSDPQLKKALLLLSISLVYAYENANHVQVDDYKTYNNDFKKWLNSTITKEQNEEVALRRLCYIIKQQTSSNLGGLSPYKKIDIEPISINKNTNGIVLDTMESKIYLGKSCDAVSGNRKGTWYNEGEYFFVKLGDDIYKFNKDDKVFSLNCEKPSK